MIQHARALIADKKAGDVRLVHGSYLQDWLLFDTDYNWRLEPAVGGKSRAVADIGSHWCDLIQHVTGLKIVEVMADLSTVIPVRKKPKTAIETFAGKALKPSDYDHMKIATEDYASVLFRFDNGARGVFTVSQVSPGRKNRLYFEIDGSYHSMVWDQEKPEEMWMGYRDRPNELLVRTHRCCTPRRSPTPITRAATRRDIRTGRRISFGISIIGSRRERSPAKARPTLQPSRTGTARF